MAIQKHLKLKTVSSEQVDLESWQPTTLEDIHICLDLGIRVRDLDDDIVVNVTLASPEALRYRQLNKLNEEKHTVVVQKYNYDYLKKMLRDLIRQCNRETRYDSYIALQKYFRWDDDFCKLESTH